MNNFNGDNQNNNTQGASININTPNSVQNENGVGTNGQDVVQNQQNNANPSEVLETHYKEQLKQQSKNLTEQNKIINDAYANNKNLEAKIAEQEAKIAELVKSLEAEPKQPQVNLDEYTSKLNQFEDYITKQKQKEAAANEAVIIQKTKEMKQILTEAGIVNNEMIPELKRIDGMFGTDFSNNPNPDALRNLLNSMNHTNEPNYGINGANGSASFGYNRAQKVQEQRQAEIDKINKYIEDLDNNSFKRGNK